MKTLLKILLPVVILAAGAALFLKLKASRPEPVAMQAPEKQWVVTAERVAAASLHPVARLYGRIESPAQVGMSAAVAAEVIEVAVLEGDVVSAGDLLVRLDDADLRLTLGQRQAELAEIEARIDSEHNRYAADLEALEEERALLELARRNLERARRLAVNQAGSEAGVDDARQIIRTRALAVLQRELNIGDHDARLAQLTAAAARARAARDSVVRDIERTEVRAWFDARITSVGVARGQRVRVGDVLVQLFDISRLEVRAQIPERHMAAVRGDLDAGRAVVATARFEGRAYRLFLNRLAGEVRAGQGGLDGFFGFDGEPLVNVEVGRVVNLDVRLPAVDDAFSLPLTALYGSDTVYRIVDDRMRSTAVRHVGEHRAENGERRALLLSQALVDGDTVVTVQIPAAVDGLKVQVSTR